MTGFIGTAQLIRLALRRDRVMLPVWLLVFVTMAAGSAASTIDVYPTPASRVQAAGSINDTPSLVALYGPVYDPTSLGAVALIKLIALGAALVAVLSIVTVVRHTRAEEEAGRLELVGATVVGRHATMTAALLATAGAMLLLGAFAGLALVGSGLAAPGSFALGAAWAASGVSFAAVAAVAAQLTSSARAATGLSCAVLGAAYLARAIGDTASSSGPEWLTWLSPIGWSQQVRPFAGDRWPVLLIGLAFAATLTALAYWLAARRDLGAGLLADRPGAAAAAPSLRSPLALAWRLQRGVLLGWTLGFAVLGAALGNMATNIGSLLDSPQARDMILRLGGRHGLTDSFLAAELGFVGVFVTAYGVQAVLRLRSEETGSRAEPVLATGVSRLRWLGSHLLVALAGSGVLLAVTGAAAGVTAGSAAGSSVGHEIPRLLGASLAQLPAVWLVVGLTLAAYGLTPRLAVLGWAALVAFLLLGELGPLFRFSHWVMDLSPYGHLPRLPGGSLAPLSTGALAAVALVLLGAGAVGFRRRDLG